MTRATVVRMRATICGVGSPAYRFAHAGYVAALGAEVINDPAFDRPATAPGLVPIRGCYVRDVILASIPLWVPGKR